MQAVKRQKKETREGIGINILITRSENGKKDGRLRHILIQVKRKLLMKTTTNSEHEKSMESSIRKSPKTRRKRNCGYPQFNQNTHTGR